MIISLVRATHIFLSGTFARPNSERGASMVEYALLVALLSIAVIGGLTFFGGNVNEGFENIGSEVERVSTP